MRYHAEKPAIYSTMYGCDELCMQHPLYNVCTIFKIGDKGLAVVQQYFDPVSKTTWWGAIEHWLRDKIYLNEGFYSYFKMHADVERNGIYPTVTVRQIMWALKMKPLKKKRWETVFDRRYL